MDYDFATSTKKIWQNSYTNIIDNFSLIFNTINTKIVPYKCCQRSIYIIYVYNSRYMWNYSLDYSHLRPRWCSMSGQDLLKQIEVHIITHNPIIASHVWNAVVLHEKESADVSNKRRGEKLVKEMISSLYTCSLKTHNFESFVSIYRPFDQTTSKNND